jgi:hypothetical protein
MTYSQRKILDFVTNAIPRILPQEIALITSALVKECKVNINRSKMAFDLTLSESLIWLAE